MTLPEAIDDYLEALEYLALLESLKPFVFFVPSVMDYVVYDPEGIN